MMILFIALTVAPPATQAILPRETLAARSETGYELLSLAREEGRTGEMDAMVAEGSAFRLLKGTRVEVVGGDPKARPASAAIRVLDGKQAGRTLWIVRSDLAGKP